MLVHVENYAFLCFNNLEILTNKLALNRFHHLDKYQRCNIKDFKISETLQMLCWPAR